MSALPCSHVPPESCWSCDGSVPEFREASRALRAAEREREAVMRTPEGRAVWLATWPEAERASMAEMADRRFGPVISVMPQPLARTA